MADPTPQKNEVIADNRLAVFETAKKETELNTEDKIYNKTLWAASIGLAAGAIAPFVTSKKSWLNFIIAPFTAIGTSIVAGGISMVMFSKKYAKESEKSLPLNPFVAMTPATNFPSIDCLCAASTSIQGPSKTFTSNNPPRDPSYAAQAVKGTTLTQTAVATITA